MNQWVNEDKQRGSISLFGALSIIMGITALVSIMELANAKILDRNLDNYAKSLAPVALQSEIALSKKMVDQGVSIGIAKESLQSTLDQVTKPGSVQVNLTFGNIQSGHFVPLNAHADNPKSGLGASDPVPDFGAVAVQLIGPTTMGLTPQGRAIYGISDANKNSPDLASCFCDLRYDQCLQQTKTNSAMGDPDTQERQRYCETGIAPSVSGGMMGMFFGGDAEYYQVDSVQFSPQWVGKPYQNGAVQTDLQSSAWQTVQHDEPLTVSNGTNPFSEASWDAANGIWKEGNYPMEFTGYKNVSSFFGTFAQYKNPWKVDGTFYVGRSGTCSYPSNGFFFFGMLNQIQDFMVGNTDCLRYTADPASKYEYTD
ncbi:MAG: hypothetical protein R3219_06595, partial [Hydrogenovibrio sp.]|nr:hypothetical protein [Hydrogenovibrio sp.]